MIDPVGGFAVPPAEGKRGAMSGGNSVYEESGGFGSNAAEVEVGLFEGNATVDETTNVVVMAAARKPKEAIVMVVE